MADITKLKITDLRKYLKELNEKELTNLIVDLYKLDSNVKDYLSVKFVGEETIEALFERAKKDINEEFFPNKGFGKMRLNKAKKAISDFKKLTNDHIRTCDLMLYYVEVGTEFTNIYGDIDAKFYNSMVSMFVKVTEACEQDDDLYEQFKGRLYAVVVASDGIGWGYSDDLDDIYDSLLDWYDD